MSRQGTPKIVLVSFFRCRNQLYSHCYFSAPTEVICALGPDVHWIDYVPRRVIRIAKTSMFAAIAMDDGAINIYSPQGKR